MLASGQFINFCNLVHMDNLVKDSRQLLLWRDRYGA